MLSRFRKIMGSRAGDPSAPRAINRRIASAKSKTAQESFEFTNGGVLCFSTRTESASLGYSFDVIFYDEAQLLTKAQTQTLNPTTTHSPHRNSQLIYVGTPTRAGCTADRFRVLRDEAWSDAPGDDVCWLEYGAEEVGDPMDESRWPLVNPSLAEGLVEAEDIRTGVNGMKGDDLAIAQEYLGYWLPPQSQVEEPVIGAVAWGECLVGSGPELTAGCKICAGVRFSADGSTVAVACAVRPPGSPTAHVELPFCKDPEPSTDWLAYWIAARASRYACVAIDGKAGAGALCDKLEGMGMPKDYILRPSTDQAVTAASLISSGAKAGSVTHIACPALDLSAETSPKRKIGSGGGWGFGGDNAAPIEAAGLALLALNTSKRKPGMKARVT